MCLQCEARSFSCDSDCAGCRSRSIERMPEKFRRDAFKALPQVMQDEVRKVRAARAAALDAEAAQALSPAHRAFLTSQKIDRGGNRWQAYRRLQQQFRAQFPEATSHQHEIAMHRLAELLGV